MGDAEKRRSAKDLRKEYPAGIPECGVDGLRFALCSYLEGPNMPGTINLDIQRAVSARHMCNKLWNASRFVLSHVQAAAHHSSRGEHVVHPDEVQQQRARARRLASAWILSRLDKTVREVDRSMEAFELASTTTALRTFLVNDFCDVYLEIVKAPLVVTEAAAKEGAGARKSGGGGGGGRGGGGGGGGDEEGRDEEDDVEHRAFLSKVLWTCLSTYLKLLHPIMPFVTEEIHESAMKAVLRAPSGQIIHGQGGDGDEGDQPLVHQGFPKHGLYVCEDSEADFACGVLQPARAVRSLRKLAADTFGKEAMEGARVEILAREDEDAGALVAEHLSSVQQLSRCRDVSVVLGVRQDGEGEVEADSCAQTCLSRQLLFPQGRGALTIRVVLPPTVLVVAAAENARAEIKRLNTRLSKSAAQLKKLEALTSRPTYLELSPPDVQAKHAQKIGELGVDIEDMQCTVEILESVTKYR
jgi:valyl-tRNA synthetase